jgi:hypothetical protein
LWYPAQTQGIINNKTNMDIVTFAKNLTLSSDEKLLREVGIKDNCGNYTGSALDIVEDLEAVELGFKSFEHAIERTGVDIQSSTLEAARLFKKYEAKLIEIAKAKKEEEKYYKK